MMRHSMRGIFSGVLAAASVAATNAGAQDISVSTTVAFESRYLFRGFQFAETSFQPAINLGYKNFYASAWLNLPVGDDDFVATPGGEELDLVIGYSTALNDLLSIDSGLTYYTFPNSASGFFDLFEEDGDGLGSNTLEPYLGLSFATTLSPSIYVYRDFNFDTFTLQANASHSVPLGGKFSAAFSGNVGYVFDDAGGTDYLYGAGTANVSYAYSDKSSIYLGVRYGGSDIAGGSVIDDSILGTRKASTLWWGLGFSATF